MIQCFLIYKEPNVNDAVVYLFYFAMMIFCGGLSYKFIGRVFLFLRSPVIGFLVWYIQRPFQILLHGYQLNTYSCFSENPVGIPADNSQSAV